MSVFNSCASPLAAALLEFALVHDPVPQCSLAEITTHLFEEFSALVALSKVLEKQQKCRLLQSNIVFVLSDLHMLWMLG